jgi:hypothetical protein
MRSFRIVAFSTVVLSAAGLGLSCGDKNEVAFAKKIASRTELIGGPGALGEVGDYLLANDKIRVIIQGPGYSRGFGVYGGAIIDADLQRPGSAGDSRGGQGKDQFAEMFPAFFLKAMAPREGDIRTEIGEDGSASVVVKGASGDFLFLLQRVNDIVASADGIAFENRYTVRPGKRYVEVTTSITNVAGKTLDLPGEGIQSLVGDDVDFAIPAGDVLLFGARNKLFAPGAGFDIRFTLEDLYKKEQRKLPQLPGLVTQFIASRGDHISYGFASGVSDPEVSFVKRAGYEDVRPDDLVVPFIFSAFTGSFYAAAPKKLLDRESFSFKKYFIVGTGDVASIRDVIHEIRGYQTGELSGLVREEAGKAPEVGVSVVTYDSKGKPYNQHTTDTSGYFRGTYEPGSYTYRVVSDGRFTTAPVAFEITAGKKVGVEIELPMQGLVSVRVLGEDGRALPAKCSLVGTYSEAASGFDPMRFLYDLKVGEPMLPTDIIPDTSDPSTREYIEELIFAGMEPVTEAVRPGKYRAVCSRGIEYDIAEKQIEVQAGRLATIDVMLKHSTPTPGWASGDYHLHSTNSIDSSLEVGKRVTTIAAEGVDIALSSDHNFVTDYAPEIARLGLERYVQGMVGLELTTLEIGHFNGFPLKFEPGPITKGAFEWSGRPPRALFDDLRARGAHGKDQTVVQVNHPRSPILGYFADYNWNPDTGEPEESPNVLIAPEGPEFGPERFDLSFDALEIFNGKHFEELRSYRVPEVLPEPPLPADIPPAGTVLRDSSNRIAFPGGMDDWFVLLDQGRRYTATGNSDSHNTDDEAGYPRTYTAVSNDAPGEIDELDVVRAMKSQRAVVTNGPLVELSVNGKGMGEIASAPDGKVNVKAIARAASWMDLSSVTVIVNGEAVETVRGDRTQLQNVELNVDVDRDSWVIVEARGEKSMWPVVTPLEIPSLQITDAVGSLASSLGVDLNPFGNLQPKKRGIVTPYGFTNPVFVDADGDGQYTGSRQGSRALRTPVDGLHLRVRNPKAKEIPLVLKIFGAFRCPE